MNMRDEPVGIPAATLSFATAILALLTGTGTISGTVAGLAGGVVAAAITLVAVVVQRPRVTPNHRATPEAE